jgi:hypothetical protein
LIAVNKFFGLQKPEDEQQVLRSIAKWLNIFIFNIRKEQLVRMGILHRFWFYLRKTPYFRVFLRFTYRLFKSLTCQKLIKIDLRLKKVEPYIINK